MMPEPVHFGMVKGAFLASLYYHPVGLKHLVNKVRGGKKLKNVDSLAGDAFASCWNNILRLPPEEYYAYRDCFFETPLE
jgi:hypothetical protein